MNNPLNRKVFAAWVLAIATASAAYPVETPRPTPRAARDLSRERIELKVKTGDDDLDARVYELARQQFSTVMPLAESPPYTAAFEIVFTTAGQGLLGGKTGLPASGRGEWFSGGVRASEETHPAGGPLTWQTSDMTAALKDADGAVIWKTTYHYNGGYELSGYTVHTPEQAARLILRRLAAKFAKDRQAAALGN